VKQDGLKDPGAGLVFFLTIGMLALGLSFPLLSSADIYKFVDEDGVTHITNVPTDSRYRLWWKEATPSQRRALLKSPPFESMILDAARKHNVESDLIKAVIKAESDFNHRAVSRKGAKGLMQLMPRTADRFQVRSSFDPWSNIEGGARYLRHLLDLFNGDLTLALAAYNAGEGAVAKYNNQVPPYQETRTYIQRVLRYFRQYKSEPGRSVRASY
jgi:soluble lytic murein transglycosylase-like protein